MKRMLLTAVLVMQITGLACTVSYAAEDAFLPEATNDFVYTVVTEEQPALQTPEAAPERKEYKSDRLTVNFTVEGEGYTAENDIKFALYDGSQLIGETSAYVTSDTKHFSVTFNVPEYTVGKTFYIACSSGAWGIRYYDDFYNMGAGAPVPTYAYTDESGKDVVVAEAAMNILTYKEKSVNVYVDGKRLSLRSPARFIRGTVMTPVREMAGALGIFDVTYNPEYDSVRVAAGKDETLFNIGSPWTTVKGVNRADNVPTIYIGGNVYAPVKTLSDGVLANAQIWEHDAYVDVILNRSRYVVNYIDKVNYVTKQALTSKTDYLIWISKANYEVNVFKNDGGVWNFVRSFRCAIGTSSTPTCTGTYRYYEKIARWPYPDFYVGPVMRFNGGYAIHSTLLKYDGSDYNRTVGKKLSHGCVRVQPPDMNWLIDNIPMYTTVHITDA